MNIKQLREELHKLMEDTYENTEKLEEIVLYIDSKLSNPQYPLLNLSVDDFESNWIIADYDIDNDLHNTYNHDDLIKDLRELDKKVRIFDEITDLGDGILELYLSIGSDTPKEDIDEIIKGLEQIPAIIKKYYKDMNESLNEENHKGLIALMKKVYGNDKVGGKKGQYNIITAGENLKKAEGWGIKIVQELTGHGATKDILIAKDENELKNKLQKQLNKNESTETTREVLPIKFVRVDEWNRPIFKPVDKNKKYYLSDVNNLFDEDATEKEIKAFYSDMAYPLRDYITFHGYSVDSEPMGSQLKFDLEIV